MPLKMIPLREDRDLRQEAVDEYGGRGEISGLRFYEAPGQHPVTYYRVTPTDVGKFSKNYHKAIRMSLGITELPHVWCHDIRGGGYILQYQEVTADNVFVAGSTPNFGRFTTAWVDAKHPLEHVFLFDGPAGVGFRGFVTPQEKEVLEAYMKQVTIKMAGYINPHYLQRRGVKLLTPQIIRLILSDRWIGGEVDTWRNRWHKLFADRDEPIVSSHWKDIKKVAKISSAMQ
jgi:hypothetical protein